MASIDKYAWPQLRQNENVIIVDGKYALVYQVVVYNLNCSRKAARGWCFLEF